MPFYHRLGKIPPKRHMALRKADGEAIHYEQLMGNKGFTGPSSLLYHLRPPTSVRAIDVVKDMPLAAAPEEGPHRHRHFRAMRLSAPGSSTTDRIPLLFNADISCWWSTPTRDDVAFYRNGQADELIYVAEGGGTLESQFGELAVRSGDYVVIPRGILHRWRWEGEPKLMVLESTGYVRTPKGYRNEHGQLLEGAPFSERDIRRPEGLQTVDEEGEFEVWFKHGHRLTKTVLDHHPFDVVGWDGYYYPWALSIHDFEPKVARYHLPPPVHQTFESENYVICSFCPRPFDFGEEAVPAPYFHSNVMSDEVIFYAKAEFMSRKGIEYGSMTLHPDGLPHGPQPGKMEESIGAKWTDELGVMFDTFRPLQITPQALGIEDPDYHKSWVE